MTKVIKHKSLSSEFGRVRLNENDLFRIAKIIENLAASYDGKADIVMVSADGEETYGGGPQKLDSVLSSDSDHSWRI